MNLLRATTPKKVNAFWKIVLVITSRIKRHFLPISQFLDQLMGAKLSSSHHKIYEGPRYVIILLSLNIQSQ